MAIPAFMYAASLFAKTSLPPDASLSFIDYLEPRISLICIAGLPLLLFDIKKEKGLVWGSYSVYFLLLVGGEWIDSQLGVSIHERDIHFDNRISLIVSPGLALAFSVGAYSFLVLLSRQYEEAVTKKNEELSGTEEELRQNLEELQLVQERLARQEKKLSTVINNLPTGIVITNPTDGKIIMANQRAEQLLRLPNQPEESLIGQSMVGFYVEDDGRKRLLEGLQKDGKLSGLRLLAHSPDGPKWVSVYARMIQLDGNTNILASFIDIEKQLRYEKQLEEQGEVMRQKNEELQKMEEELRQNVEELQAQRDFVEQANEQIKRRNKAINRHSKVLMGLSKHQHIQKGNWEDALELLTNTVSQVLDIGQVSVWDYRQNSQKLYCEKLFERESFSYRAGQSLDKHRASAYFQRLFTDRVFSTHNAHEEAGTKELSKAAILGEEVQSTVEASYLINGELKGVLRCENLGTPREWQLEELSFVKAIAEMLALVYQNSQQAQANIYVRKSTEILSQLAKNELLIRGDWKGFLEEITQQCAHHSSISRVSVWEFQSEDLEDVHLECIKLYELDKKGYSEGVILKKSDFPEYFRALSRQQPIIAHKAREHQATACFNQGYFDKFDIYSLLDVPYFINGRLKGLICCEQQGHERTWTLEDQLFIKSLADLVTVAYQNAIQLEQQQALSQTNAELRNTQQKLEQNLLDLEATRTALSAQKETLDQEHRNTLNSIEYAKTMQQAILPQEGTKQQLFPESFIIYWPKDIVSGDFYWMSGDENRKVLAVIDCTGHGVPGAFMSIIGYNLLSEIILQQNCYTPPEILKKLHAGVVKSLRQGEGANDDGMDLSICVIEPHENGQVKVQFEGAKSNMYYTDQGGLKVVKGTRRSVGGKHASRRDVEFTSKEVIMQQGDMIYLSTDGLQDQNNSKRRRFSSQNLRKLIQEMHAFPAEKQKEYIEATVSRFMGKAEQRDDITLVGVRV